MKQSFLAGLAVAMLWTTSALAQTVQLPLITKVNASGFTPTDWVRVEKCEVFSDHVLITRQYGIPDDQGFTAVERREVVLSSGINTALRAALTEPVQQIPNFLCDGPSSEVTAQRADSPRDTFVLYSAGGCGTPGQVRNGGATRMLRDLVDLYCPHTTELPSTQR